MKLKFENSVYILELETSDEAATLQDKIGRRVTLNKSGVFQATHSQPLARNRSMDSSK